MPSPLFDQHLSLLQRVEDLAVKKLVPELCSEMPRRRHTSPVLCPCESRTSASRSFPIICSGVYLFRLILSSSFKVQNKPDSLNQPGPLFPWQVTLTAELLSLLDSNFPPVHLANGFINVRGLIVMPFR